MIYPEILVPNRVKKMIPKGGPKYFLSENIGLFNVTAQLSKKNGNILACLGAEIFVKMCQNQAVWFGWGFLGSFWYFSWPPGKLEPSRFFAASICSVWSF